MSTYLVDFENVGVGGMDGVEKLSDRDRVVIFYGKQAAAVPFERHIEIASSRAEVRYIKVDKTGKNFLDFQLSSYCGYLIGSTSEKEFIIVSRDNGFSSMEDFWHGKEMSGKKISMKRRPAIAVSGEELENVREIIVDKGERLAASSGEDIQEKKEGQKREQEHTEIRKKSGKNRRKQGRPQQAGAIRIQTISSENRKQNPEQNAEPKESAEGTVRKQNQEEYKESAKEKEGTDRRNNRKRGSRPGNRQDRDGQKEKKTDAGQGEKPLEKVSKPEQVQEKQPEEVPQKNDASQKTERTQERHPYRKSRRRSRGRYVWKRQ